MGFILYQSTVLLWMRWSKGAFLLCLQEACGIELGFFRQVYLLEEKKVQKQVCGFSLHLGFLN